MGAKNRVSDEEIKKIVEWKESNNKTWPDAAAKYGFTTGDNLYQTYKRRKDAGFQKQSRKPYTKRSHKFVDLAVSAPMPSSVAVIFCKPSQLIDVLSGLK